MLTRVRAALRGRAAVLVLGLGLASASGADACFCCAGAIGTGFTAGSGVWSRIGARAADVDAKRRGDGRWRKAAAAQPGQEGGAGTARRTDVVRMAVRSMLVEARSDIALRAIERGLCITAESAASGEPSTSHLTLNDLPKQLASDWLAPRIQRLAILLIRYHKLLLRYKGLLSDCVSFNHQSQSHAQEGCEEDETRVSGRASQTQE